MSSAPSPELAAALRASALARELAGFYYALPGVTATVWLPLFYLVAPWYVGLICLCGSCLVWVALRDRPSFASWQLTLFALRTSSMRYPVTAITGIYFLYRGRWALLVLAILTPLLCRLLRFVLLSGKMIEVEEIQSRFFNEILAKSCDLTGQGMLAAGGREALAEAVQSKEEPN